MKRIYRRLWLFIRIVGGDFAGVENALTPRLAWRVTGIIHPER